LAKCILKATKKVQLEPENLNVERILLFLHRYLVQYSQNLNKFTSEGKEGNKNGLLAAKNLVYEL
jgi:hypothetical protein